MSEDGAHTAFLESVRRIEMQEQEVEEQLKPCPFCGGKPKVIIEEDFAGDQLYYHVWCRECGIQLWAASRSVLLKKWNRRESA